MGALKSAGTALEWQDHRPNVAVLASRKLYCIHEKISKLPPSQQGDGCRQLLEMGRSGCSFHSKASSLTARVSRLCDIEELVQSGKEHGGCPYYAAQVSLDLVEFFLLLLLLFFFFVSFYFSHTVHSHYRVVKQHACYNFSANDTGHGHYIACHCITI